MNFEAGASFLVSKKCLDYALILKNVSNLVIKTNILFAFCKISLLINESVFRKLDFCEFWTFYVL